ncbi:MAG: hypothetical protein JJ920_05830 [Roseitalea sp.]|jgi:hypothetical protein|nr:hypothetical protein [Roseitalea sp.]MBO6722262.1 hypothetical protein [Roseitalea sp.]MBO6742409.1 hypothetical protein [Roseitalea sp.]
MMTSEKPMRQTCSQITQTIPLTALAVRARPTHRRRDAIAVLAAQFAAVAALIWLAVGTMTAHAGDLDALDAGEPAVLAYAEPLPERFADPFAEQRGLDAHDSHDGHPLNDAWMGLNAVTADGVIAGYVSDAFVNPDGSIDEVIITPAPGTALTHPVYVPVEAVEFDGVEVGLIMTMAVLATQEPVTEDFAAYTE